MNLTGYAIVSTEDQSLALQLDTLTAAGCARVLEDTASGARWDRSSQAAAVASCAFGDVLTVWKLDRLGRSVLDLVELVETLKGKQGNQSEGADGCRCSH